MKKIIVLITLALVLIIPGMVFAAGSCTQTITEHNSVQMSVTFSCTGDAADGTIPDTDTATTDANGKILNATLTQGWYLHDVKTVPGATAPDAADVLIKDTDGLDLLDGLGTNLIHATNPQSMGDSMPFYPPVTGVLTLDVNNQDTVSATYTVELKFGK